MWLNLTLPKYSSQIPGLHKLLSIFPSFDVDKREKQSKHLSWFSVQLVIMLFPIWCCIITINTAAILRVLLTKNIKTIDDLSPAKSNAV